MASDLHARRLAQTAQSKTAIILYSSRIGVYPTIAPRLVNHGGVIKASIGTGKYRLKRWLDDTACHPLPSEGIGSMRIFSLCRLMQLN
ncbi:MAG: hypothetical protein WCC58_08490 [Burkholderiales bacterium]